MSRAQSSITYLTWSGPVAARLAQPAADPGPPVLVLHEWWAPVADLGRVPDRLAAAGFVALAPDLHGHHREHGDTRAGYGSAVPLGTVVEDLGAALRHLESHPASKGRRVGLVGFCVAGDAALELAVREASRIGAVVLFEGTGDAATDHASVRTPVLGHVGADDPWCPPEDVERLCAGVRAAGTAVDVRSYPGRSHGFVDPETPFGTYDEADADAAWDATTAFLHEHLG